MILSRAWYGLLGLAVAVALYVVYIAVGQYDRAATRALKERLASDSQTVEWALKIDARRRIDALLVGSVDAALQQALAAANGSREGKPPDAAKQGARKALTAIGEAIPVDWRADALFAVDRDGRVIAELGFDQVAGNDDFELGGYPAVNDALHGWLRDDVWLLGSKMYIVAARPVEYDVAQRPAGAIVGLKEVNKRFADDLAKRTRTALAFFVSPRRVAAGIGVDGFDEEKLDAVGNELSKIDEKAYGDGGRSDVRMLGDDLGAMYARLPGEVWPLGGGFAVARAQTLLTGPMGFLSSADDKDKANVPWLLLVAVALVAAVVGVAFTLFEHTMPLGELVTQADRLKKGTMDGLQVARFRGSYRLAAQAINEGIEHAIEKAGGKTRKPADLESILGPVPSQPAMSAFAFPMGDGRSPGGPPVSPPGGPSAPFPPPPRSASQPGVVPKTPPAAGFRGPPPPLQRPMADSAGAGLPTTPAAPPAAPTSAHALGEDDDDATMVGAVPPELMAEATGDQLEEKQWIMVYEDFVRTKKQCGESVDGLSLEKFASTLRKNRDALIAKHGCKRVRFSVYVKEGRASLKATPVRE
jgi:hypothetical protein